MSNNILEYMGYKGEYKIVDDFLYQGHILDIPDTRVFEGSTLEELIRDFHEVVEEYDDLKGSLYE